MSWPPPPTKWLCFACGHHGPELEVPVAHVLHMRMAVRACMATETAESAKGLAEMFSRAEADAMAPRERKS